MPNSKQPQVAASAQAIPYSQIREIAEMAMGMDNVLKLYFGESNLGTPQFIKDAATKAMADGFTIYTPNAGLLSTREAIAEYTQKMHGVTLDPKEEIVVTASGGQALNAAIRCCVDAGDEAIFMVPAFRNASSILRMYHAVPVELPHVLAGGRYSIDFEMLERAVTPRTKLLIYTSPSNPLGWTATLEEQQKLLEFARRHGLWLMADEVYERLTYTGEPVVPSILRLATREDAVIVVQSFSKAYSMTGWRLGWITARRDLAKKAAQLNEFIVLNATGFIQRAGETALREGEGFVAEMRKMLVANREYGAARLRKMPRVTLPEPEGAFYLFPAIAGMENSVEFCKGLLRETRTGFAPGAAFGEGGEGHIRICYSVDPELLKEALDRLEGYLAK